jgi:hypothetical protein
LDGTNLPTNFRTQSKNLRLEIYGRSRHFSAKVVYSGDCPVSTLKNAFPKDSQKIAVGFREDSEFVCTDSEQTNFIAACSIGSKWSKTSNCSNETPAQKICVVKKITNGWVIELDRKTGTMKFECRAGFAPLPSNSVVVCNNGKWSDQPKCKRKSKLYLFLYFPFMIKSIQLSSLVNKG